MKRRLFLSAGAVAAASFLAGCKREDVASKNISINRGRKFEIRLCTSWPANFPIMGEGVERFAKRVAKATDSEVVVKVFPKNVLVPALQVFDACSMGQIEAFHSGPYYWKGKNASFALFGGFPFGFTSNEMGAWLQFEGGLDLWREIYAKYGLYPLAGGNTDIQMGGWFRKEIKSLEDLKGLKMRIPGLGGEVMAKLGVNPVNIPAGEIYTALERGVIDATEWVGPALDIKMGFYKVAKYYYSGFHEPGSVLELTFNLKFWRSLPEDIKRVIQAEASTLNSSMVYDFQAKNAEALEKLSSFGVVLKRWPEEIVAQAKKALEEVVSEQCKKSEDFKRVWKSIEPFWQKTKRWSSLGLENYLRMRES